MMRRIWTWLRELGAAFDRWAERQLGTREPGEMEW